MNIVWTDYLEREKEPEVTAPVPWTREVNLPPQSLFRGEWYPARLQREAQERATEEDNSTIRKWLKLAAYLITGTLFVGGSLGLYILALMWIGTP